MRKKVIIERGYLRYVGIFREQEVLLNKVDLIRSTSSLQGRDKFLEVQDHQGYVFFTIPYEVLPAKDYVRFTEAVKKDNPNTEVDLSYFKAWREGFL